MARHAMLCGTVAVWALLAAQPALSAPLKADIDAQQDFQIPSQPLDTALLLYSRQSGLQIIASAPAVANTVAPALRGRMTPRQALQNLLRGSNLSFVISNGSIAITPGSAAYSQGGLTPAALRENDTVQAGPFAPPPPAAEPAPAPSPVPPGASGATTPPDQGHLLAGTVTVTGTRIIRNGYSAPTPVTVAPIDQLEETTPSDIADALNKLPVFQGSTTNNGEANPLVPNGNYLNLYGLGDNRTLVLLDGQRVPTTSSNNAVDINTLPQLLVQRVDIVTGGASAVYGSDAIGGVVNYVLNSKFNGIKGVAQTGISTYGDAPSQKVGLAVGAPVFANGHVIFSYEHNQAAGLNQADRSFTNNLPYTVGLGTAASPYVTVTNAREAAAAYGGYINAVSGGAPASLVGQQFVGAGTLASFTPGTPTGTTGIDIGGQGAYYTGLQMVKPVETDQIFSRFDYDLGHNITAYAEINAGLSQENFTPGTPQPQGAVIYSGNPYLPTGFPAMPTGSTLTLSSVPENFVYAQQVNQWASNYLGTVGLQGKAFNDDFNWNAFYAHGQGLTHAQTENNINTSHFYAALDAVRDPSTGNTVCWATLHLPGQYPGCAPLNFIGQGNESQAALNYIYQNTAYDIINRVDDYAGSISGSAFKDWAGPVSVAANFEYRKETFIEDSDAPPSCAPQLTGLRTTWVTTGLRSSASGAPSSCWLSNTTAAQTGAESVWEVGGETVVPLLKDFTLAKNLEINGAVRYTDYSVSGTALTWKVGLNYQPIEDVRIRTTQSHDIRAPDLLELFQAPTMTSVAITNDPVSGQSGSVTETTEGNINVKPEVANSTTLGVVYSPSWLRRFRASFDYYNIDITGSLAQSITGINVNPTLQNCYLSNGTSAYCQAIVRGNGATAFPTGLLNFPVNLAEQYTRGFNLEASYSFDWSAIYQRLPGQTDLRALANYTAQNGTITAPGTAAELTRPGPKFTAFLNYRLGPFTAAWQTTYTGGSKQGAGSPAPVYYVVTHTPALVMNDLNLSYRFKADGRNLQAFLVINNIFNQTPLIYPAAGGGIPGDNNPVSGSTLGRYFTGGIKFNY
jgi:iron complex outermembrane receptor protein